MTRWSLRRAIVRQWLDRFQTSYWFVPVLASLLAVLLARLLIWVDAQIPNDLLAQSSIVYTGEVVETRSGLLSMAGTILGTAGIVFSLLTVPMSVAASQFGSRLLRVYLRDRTIQLILGAFAGTFVFCITAALSVPPSDTNIEPPQIAMTLAIVLTVGCFFTLIALIHHMGTSLEAPNVVASASQELHEVLDAAQSWADESDEDKQAPLEWWAAQLKLEGLPIYATRTGYIQAIDADVIRPLALQHNLIIRFVSKPGNFVQEDDLVALVYPPHHVEPKVAQYIRDCYMLGNLRTPSQDTQYAFNQLVEVALRAMSSAINDPYTALTCLDHLGAGLASYIDRSHHNAQNAETMRGQRILFNPLGLVEVLDGCFHMLRRASREMPEVLLGMTDALEVAAQQCTSTEELAEIVRHLQLIEMESQASASIVPDKQRVSNRCQLLAARYGEATSSFKKIAEVTEDSVS